MADCWAHGGQILAANGGKLKKYRNTCSCRSEMGGSMTSSESPLSASAHPPTWKFDYPVFHAETRTQWRTWLTLNHTAARCGSRAVPIP